MFCSQKRKDKYDEWFEKFKKEELQRRGGDPEKASPRYIPYEYADDQEEDESRLLYC